MNRFDQLPQDLKIKIYEYNADHRPQWKDVMRDLIMYDGDLLMEFLYEHRHDFMYDQAKEIEGYYIDDKGLRILYKKKDGGLSI